MDYSKNILNILSQYDLLNKIIKKIECTTKYMEEIYGICYSIVF